MTVSIEYNDDKARWKLDTVAGMVNNSRGELKRCAKAIDIYVGRMLQQQFLDGGRRFGGWPGLGLTALATRTPPKGGKLTNIEQVLKREVKPLVDSARLKKSVTRGPGHVFEASNNPFATRSGTRLSYAHEHNDGPHVWPFRFWGKRKDNFERMMYKGPTYDPKTGESHDSNPEYWRLKTYLRYRDGDQIEVRRRQFAPESHQVKASEKQKIRDIVEMHIGRNLQDINSGIV